MMSTSRWTCRVVVVGLENSTSGGEVARGPCLPSRVGYESGLGDGVS
jgi:hypothetical protein